MKNLRNIALKKNACGQPYAWYLKMQAGACKYDRTVRFESYGGRQDALAWTIRLRDAVQAALDAGDAPAWVFYIYGGAAHPGLKVRDRRFKH